MGKRDKRLSCNAKNATLFNLLFPEQSSKGSSVTCGLQASPSLLGSRGPSGRCSWALARGGPSGVGAGLMAPSFYPKSHLLMLVAPTRGFELVVLHRCVVQPKELWGWWSCGTSEVLESCFPVSGVSDGGKSRNLNPPFLIPFGR